MLTYREKHEQANREARATVMALLITIVVWIVGGFGLASFDITIFHTPLWVIGGTLGAWLCAIVVSIVLSRRFKGFDFEDEELAAAGGSLAEEVHHG